MNKPIHPLALFRLSVLGPLASRDNLKRGELKTLISDLASKTYSIPGSTRVHLSPKSIENWYYAWLKKGIEGLEPKIRCDKHKTHLAKPIQEALLTAKQANKARSINTLITLLEAQGLVQKGELARATVHRFLQQHQLSKQTPADAITIERRAFVATHAGDIWHGDVLHGPSIPTPAGHRKTYLVSLLDDASRLIAHSAFCLGETALDIEGVLKQALLKRGIPKKLIIDNGAAYRAQSLQTICAKLQIRLVYCKPYEPQGKGKLERFHRTFRELFLQEINLTAIHNLGDLNARLWAWIEQIYHQRPHAGLQGQSPLARFRQDLIHIRPLGALLQDIDDLFCHRVKRFIRKDGTCSWEGQLFEVPYQYAHQTVWLVIEPHELKALRIESPAGEPLGPVTPLDAHANTHRRRQRPTLSTRGSTPNPLDAVEMAYIDYRRLSELTNPTKKEEN